MNKDITIGMDMGDKNHKAVILGGDGRELGREEVANTREAIAALLRRHPGATLAIETGTHCRWVAALASGMGARVLVANARKVRAIWGASRKNDWRDAEMLARIARTDPSLLHPVTLRGAEDQRLMRLVKARDALVRCRTALVNQVRGFCKAEGVRLRKCSPEAFTGLEGDLPEAVAGMAQSLLDAIDGLGAMIRSYDGLLRDALDETRGEEARRLMQAPGVGPVTAAAFLAAVGDVAAFGGRARDAGPLLGLVPRQSQSGDGDPQLRITKEGNAVARRLLVVAANHILGPFGKDCDLRRHGLRIAGRGGKNARKRAKVAVARKLAVAMLAMLMGKADYRPFAEGAPPGGVAAAAGEGAPPDGVEA